ncbi:thiol:disulfide interchange protein [Leptospira hartskeerlii]|uniref:Thiol:disulfide interchange protein n=1 Tax=Leptospira hartskeerlii TaxID=2023177 RepID=A0A2M9XCN0_9LEPT|nr:thioredoxin family protein [Leptospira hartskeerlii]PJZ25349.1 thiol:disulfide interchange protein [Leptospira hartskeerlii]PJZ32671.1 thiol:disulfide interchange protein [Leptospira hartskeerlii]
MLPFSKIRSILILICLTLASEMSAEVWETSVETAFNKAKKEGRPIFIDVYADWCGYCKTLKKEIYPKKEVKQELSKFVLLSLDGDRFPNLKKKYDVTGYPTLLFLDKNGSLTEKIAGMPDHKMVIKTLRSAYSKRDKEVSLLADLEKDPENNLLLLKVGEYYFEAKEYKKAADYFYRSFASEDPRMPENKHKALFNLGLSFSELKNWEKTIKTFSLYLDKFPTGHSKAALYYRGGAYSSLGKKAEAKEDLKKALELSSDPEEKKEIQDLLNRL